MRRATGLVGALLLLTLLCAGCGNRNAAAPEKKAVQATDAAPMDLPPAYMLTWNSRGWDVRIFVNGVPVGESKPPGQAGMIELRYFLADGGNEIRWEATATEENANPLEVSLDEVANGGLGDAKSLFKETTEPAAVGSADRGGKKVNAVTKATWFWQDADNVEQLTPGDEAQIKAIVDSLYKAFVNQDTEALIVILDVGSNERAKLALAAKDEVTGVLRQSCEKLFADTNYVFSRAEPSTLSLHAYGRMTKVESTSPAIIRAGLQKRDANGKEAFEPVLVFPRFYLSRHGGKWFIVR